jgi:hypothetical protein
MIAIAKDKTNDVVPAWHEDFLKLLPAIRQHASIAFRNLKPEAREEAVQEVICNALVAYRRLVELGKTDIAYASPLARYGVAQTRAGRKVGCKLNGKDALARYARIKHGICVDRLDRYDRENESWQEIVVEDRHAGPAEVAACRIDFGTWRARLNSRQRRIADLLASGESTNTVAKKMRLTPGRISQTRRELMQDWQAFTAEKSPDSAAPAAA